MLLGLNVDNIHTYIHVYIEREEKDSSEKLLIALVTLRSAPIHSERASGAGADSLVRRPRQASR